jgi:hypothetical protein
VRCGSKQIIPALLPILFTLLAWAEAAGRPSEYEVKAACLYKFARYVEWPVGSFADDQAPVIIGVIGRDPFGPILDRIVAGKVVQGRSVEIERIDSVGKLKTCHILFISSSERLRLAKHLEGLNRASVLTVSELEWFARSGGMIRLKIDQERIRFEVNVDNARRAGLRISSRLLKLATIVEDGKGD